VGDNAVYADCTHREIQIPSVWNDTDITATLNQGSLPDGTAYIFVVDSDGVASAGAEVTLGGDVETGGGVIRAGVETPIKQVIENTIR